MKKYLLIQLLFIYVTATMAQKPVLFNESLNIFLNVRDFTIDPQEKEAYFTIQSPDQGISQIVKIEKTGNSWSDPILLPFCDEFKYMEPFLSPDGKRLYFVSDRPMRPEDTARKDLDIWYVERTMPRNDWSDPINLGYPVNTSMDEFFPAVTSNNNIYFTLESPDGLGKDDIYFSEWKNGSYQSPVILDTNINSKGYEFNAFVSPDERFILYTKYNEPGGIGSGDLYISRKNKEGKWQKAEILDGDINTRFMEYCPFYNATTHTLYFTGRRMSLTPKKFKNVADFQHYTIHGENGLSKIYTIHLTLP